MLRKVGWQPPGTHKRQELTRAKYDSSNPAFVLSSEWILDQQLRVKVAFREVGADAGAIYPRLRFDFEFTNLGKNDIVLDILYMDLSVRSVRIGTIHYLGRPLPNKPSEMLAPSISYPFNFFLTLDHFGLGRLEKLRDGGDMIMSVSVGLAAEQSQTAIGQPQPGPLAQQGRAMSGRKVSPFPVVFEFRIPKSDWVERVLPQVGFSDVSLLEIPRLSDSQFADSIGYLNSAWKQYELGEYDKVLTECRKTLESLTKKVKEKGLSRDVDGKSLPDWDKLLGSEKTGADRGWNISEGDWICRPRGTCWSFSEQRRS